MGFIKRMFNGKEGQASGTKSTKMSDLELLVKSMIRKATKIQVIEADSKLERSQLISHFGGYPYFEEGEKWPVTKSGKHLEFIFQVFNDPELELPNDIRLIQFYYDWNEFPWDTESDGWLVKIYKELHPEKKLSILKPQLDVEFTTFCEIDFIPIESLPDWEGLETHNAEAADLSYTLNRAEPWESYEQVAAKLIGEKDYQSQLGGYPQWVQGDDTPKDKDGNPMKLLFQIETDEEIDLMWGPDGTVYVFYDPEQEKVEFIIQCG